MLVHVIQEKEVADHFTMYADYVRYFSHRTNVCSNPSNPRTQYLSV